MSPSSLFSVESTKEEVQKLPWKFGLTFHFLVACTHHIHRLKYFILPNCSLFLLTNCTYTLSDPLLNYFFSLLFWQSYHYAVWWGCSYLFPSLFLTLWTMDLTQHGDLEYPHISSLLSKGLSSCLEGTHRSQSQVSWVVGLLVVSLTPPACSILSPTLPQDSPSSTWCLDLCISFHLLLDAASQEVVMLGSCLQA